MLFLSLKLIFAHYVADFLLQTEWMASNKSKANKPLLVHVSIYSVCLLFLGLLEVGATGFNKALMFALINGIAHFGTDYVTSRVMSYLWQRSNVRGFFAVLGFDQMSHYLVLFTSAYYLLR
jgi:membrane-bound metal-dependent hydrolase YbcI (DUF457 family)